jgi:hypothetical protein
MVESVMARRVMTQHVDFYQCAHPTIKKSLNHGEDYVEISGSAVNLNLTYFIGNKNNELKIMPLFTIF